MRASPAAIVAAFLGAWSLVGCAEPEPVSKGEVKYAPISVSEAKTKAAKFVDDLETVPPAMRGQFVFSHAQEAHAVGVSGDKALQDRFKALLGAPR